MRIENISQEEYIRYIEMLKRKPVLEMDYTELTDLANEAMAVACREKNWAGVQAAFRLMLLAMNANAGKIHGTTQGLIHLSRKLKLIESKEE